MDASCGAVVTCLRLTGLRLELLLNFGEAFMRDGIPRVVKGLADGSES